MQTKDENMQHLAIERLAELGDLEPTAAERGHLETCTMCASELEAYRRVVAMAADERRSIAPPITQWGALRDELRTQGLITTPIEVEAGRSRRAHMHLWLRRSAAAVGFLMVGAVGGRMSAGMPLASAVTINQAADFTNVAQIDVEDFTSTASAMAALQRAQEEYERAALYLASHDTTASEGASDILRTRLAALDEMAETSRRALGDAPADPVMNQVYLTTLGARNMTLGRLASSLPVGSRLSRF